MKLLNIWRAIYHVKQLDISHLNNCKVRHETRVAKHFLNEIYNQFLTSPSTWKYSYKQDIPREVWHKF